MYELQKASMWKRISALLCDLLALAIVVVAAALLLSTIFGYDGHMERLDAISSEYEAEYNVDFEISDSDYQALPQADRDRYQEALKAFAEDSDANYTYDMIINLTFLMISFSLLIAFVLLEFVVPLLLGNGQTIGKKIFGIAVMREDGVKLTPVLLFARTILGKYTVETMIPVMIILMILLNLMGAIGTIVIIGFLILQIVLMVTSKGRTPLHDKLAHTVTVDMASQMIFDTPEELLEYKQKMHAEKVDAEKN